jgi:L-amino acid N-acyltransferase YncA
MTADIRLATETDAAAVAAIYGPVVASTVISFEAVPPDADEMRRRIRETLVAYPWLVFEVDGRVVGYAYAGRHRARAAYEWSVDASVYIDPEHHRRGIGRALYTSLFRILTAQGYVNAYAGVTLPNPASVGLHESMGFQPVGVYGKVGFKFGTWHDVGWWQLALQPHPAAPVRPVALAEVRGDPSWQAMLAAGLSMGRD